MNKTKRTIFNTAVKLFSEKGYDNTSVEEITAVAGVAKGSLYYHFAKKEDIFDMILEEGMKLLRNSIEIKWKSCNTSLEKILAIVLIQVKVVVRYEYLFNVIFSQMLGVDDKNYKCQDAIFEYIEIIEEVIKEGIKNGEFYNGDVEAMATEVFGVTFSSLMYRLKKNKEVDSQKVYKEFENTVRRAISLK